VRKILFSSLILLFATWALPSSAAAETCPDPAVGDVVYTVEGTDNTSVTECTSGTGNPNSIDDFNNADVFGGDWTSFCSTSDGTCATNYDLEINSDGTWSFTGVAGEEYALVLKDGNNPGDHSWAAFLLSDPDTSFEGTWEILFQGEPNPGRLSHVTIIDRVVTVSTTPTDTTSTPTDTTTPGPVAPEPTLLTLLGGGLLLAGRRLRRKK
jgi:hypothetical protein